MSTSMPVWAQSQEPTQLQAPADPAQANQNPAAQAPVDGKLGEAEIQQLVAPIALYPDNLLAQVLTASTYPLDVVVAGCWAHEHAGMSAQERETVLLQKKWDPSVKGLTAVPQVLSMMMEELDWMRQLGEAFLVQPDDISNAVQVLRAKAEATGTLKSSADLRVVRAPAQATAASGEYAGSYIAIEQAQPDVIRVPVYDPGVVYGTWSYSTPRPFYYRPPNYRSTAVFGFGASAAVGSALWTRYDWRRRNVVVDTTRYNNFNRTTYTGGPVWRFDAQRSGAMGYRNVTVQQQYGVRVNVRPGGGTTTTNTFVTPPRPGTTTFAPPPPQQPRGFTTTTTTVTPPVDRDPRPRGEPRAPGVVQPPSTPPAQNPVVARPTPATPPVDRDPRPRGEPRAPGVVPPPSTPPAPKPVVATPTPATPQIDRDPRPRDEPRGEPRAPGVVLPPSTPPKPVVATPTPVPARPAAPVARDPVPRGEPRVRATPDPRPTPPVVAAPRPAPVAAPKPAPAPKPVAAPRPAPAPKPAAPAKPAPNPAAPAKPAPKPVEPR